MFNFSNSHSAQTEAEVASSTPRHSLAPRTLQKANPAFHSVQELGHAVSLPECKNIALTGIYGSGKSSVINTYLLSDQAPKNILRISLSNFISSNEDLSEGDENRIECKIFQHIIYKADANKTEQSHYKRLRVLDAKTIHTIAIRLIIFFLCFVIVFEPKALQVSSCYEAYTRLFGQYGSIVNNMADIMACCLMLWYIYKVIVYLIPRISAFSISSIKANDYEVNFNEGKKGFNELLDEILYYFKAGAYDLVIFEDLDRIAKPQKLFLKLREINTLLNESADYQQKGLVTRFIYAVRDDIFKDEVRTKFFDYIIPIVPVVDYFNAGEYMITECKEVLEGIDDIDIKNLGLFVSRMRDLQNIINEYQLYRKTLSLTSKMTKKKLLAMTIYKNLFPGDYSSIHNKKGALYTVFTNKKSISDRLTTELEAERSKATEELNNRRESIYQMRMAVLDVLATKHYVTRLSILGKNYTLDAVAKTDHLYKAFASNQVDMCYVDQRGEDVGYRTYPHKFRDLLSEVDRDDAYDEQMGNLQEELSAAEGLIRVLDQKIGTIRHLSFINLLRRIGNGQETKGIILELARSVYGQQTDDKTLEELANVLHGMIRNGYITEDYSMYISYTYHGTVGEAEFKYLQSVLQGEHLPYDYELRNISAFINNIASDNYSDRSILNYYLADFIFTKNGTEAQKQNFIATARNHHDFIIGYDKHVGKKEEFFTYLFNGWSGCVSEISAVNDSDIQKSLLHIYLSIAPQSEPLNSAEIDFLSSKYDYLSEHILDFDLTKIKKFIAYFQLKFTNLVEGNAITADLYDYVVRFRHFTISQNNLSVIYGSGFDRHAITSVLEGRDELQNYVLKGIDKFASLIPSGSKEESEQALITATNWELPDEKLNSILSGQANKISSLAFVPEDRFELLIKGDYIIPSWANIRKYFDHSDEIAVIAPFINAHADVLSAEPLTEDDEKLQVLLFKDNSTLTLTAYRTLAPCCQKPFDSTEIDELEEERVEILLNNRLIPYGAEFNTFMSKYSTELLSKYIILYFKELQADKNPVDFKNSNQLGILILHSSLTDDQKASFLKDHGTLYIKDEDNESKAEYAYLICEFYHHYDFADADYELITKALENISSEGTWQLRIELINKVHNTVPYVESRTSRMVRTLGDPYNQLVEYSRKTNLEDNPQNNQLIDYIIENQPYINKKTTEDGNLKITYHKAPKEE